MSESIVLELYVCEEHKGNKCVATDKAEISGRFESASHPTLNIFARLEILGRLTNFGKRHEVFSPFP